MVFIDTGAFLARYVGRDQFHERAKRGWDQIATSPAVCLTSNFVLDETFTLLARYTSYSFAAARAKAIYDSTSLRIVRPESKDERHALGLFKKYSDQNVSFTDCVSFALMHREKVRHAFAFDRHFELAGFEIWPSERIGRGAR